MINFFRHLLGFSLDYEKKRETEENIFNSVRVCVFA